MAVLVGCATALALAPPPDRARLRTTSTAAAAARVRRTDPAIPAVALLGLATFLMVGGPLGLLAALAAMAGAHAGVRRLRSADEQRLAGSIAAQAPVACDLMAAVLASGADPASALRAVSMAMGAPLGPVLADVRARARVVGVRAVLPLGLCFLPGFLLIGVLPVVASLVGQVLAFGR